MRSMLLLALGAALLLSSCITVGTPPVVDTTPKFVTATLPATRTPFQRGTLTPTASTAAPTLAMTADPNCKDVALLVQDVTIADGTNVAYGAKFTKTWQFKNAGTCPWHGYTIAFVSGDRMGAPDSGPVDDTAPKATVNVSVDLTAPTSDGVYTGVFELRNAKGQALPIGIEKSFWVKIAVGTASVPTYSAPTSIAPTVTGTLTTPKPPGSCKYTPSPSYQGELADLINKARTDAGLSALTVNSSLTAAAQAHSVDMACFGLLSHSGSNGSTIQQRASEAGYGGGVYEVIYQSGYPQDALTWWLNDKVHYDVLMSPSAVDMGIGYAWSSDYGTGYYTVEVGH